MQKLDVSILNAYSGYTAVLDFFKHCGHLLVKLHTHSAEANTLFLPKKGLELSGCRLWIEHHMILALH